MVATEAVLEKPITFHKKFHREVAMKKGTVCILILSLCLLFCACGTNMVDLSVQCVCGKDDFSLPLETKGSLELPGTVSFPSDMNLADLKDTIDCADYGTADVQTTIYGNILTIEKTDAQAKTHVYFVYRPNGGDRMYLSDGRWMSVVLPFQFLEEREEWRQSLLSVDTDKPYPTEYTLEDFAAFYEKLEEYDLQISGNSISVQLKEEYRPDHETSYRVRLTFAENAVSFAYEEI